MGLNACATSRLRVKVRVGEGSAPRARLRAPLPPRPGRHARPWRGRRRRPAWREADVSASSAQLVHLGASACTAATVTTYYSNATRGRRSGARLRSGLRRFASPPLESRYPPRPPPLPSFIFLANYRGTSRKRCARAQAFWRDIYRAAADTTVVGPREVTSAPNRPTSGPQKSS